MLDNTNSRSSAVYTPVSEPSVIGGNIKRYGRYFPVGSISIANSEDTFYSSDASLTPFSVSFSNATSESVSSPKPGSLSSPSVRNDQAFHDTESFSAWHLQDPLSEDQDFQDDHRAGSEPLALELDLKPFFRQSRCMALTTTRAEARSVMRMHGLSETDGIMCPRQNCREIVRDVNALAYHLDIHNIGDDQTDIIENVALETLVEEPLGSKKINSKKSRWSSASRFFKDLTSSFKLNAIKLPLR